MFRARKYGCTAMQIFTKNSNTWKERQVSAEEIALFDQARIETGIRHIAAHTSYLINLASPDRHKHRRSCRALENELLRSAAMGIGQVVLHPGAHMDSGTKAGQQRIADSIRLIFGATGPLGCRILLETTAGQGSSVGHTFEQLAAILERIDEPSRTGICLDSSHIFAAGYDIRTKTAYRQTMAAFERIIGLKHLCLIHLNDSKKELGSRVDRHAAIGRGFIGLTAFECFMNDARLSRIPKIIETPKTEDGKDMDRLNLKTLRGLLKN